MRARTGTGRLLLTVVAATSVGVCLLALGTQLQPPPLRHPSTIGDWVRHTGTATAALSSVWCGAVAVTGYVIAVLALHLLTRSLDSRPLARFATIVTAPSLRRIITSIAGVGVVASTTIPSAIAQTAPPTSDPPGATMRRLPAATQPAPATMRRLPPATAADSTASLKRVDPAPAPATTVHVVGPGDCFWSIAAGQLRTAWGRQPSDPEVVPYWSALIDGNRAVLADPTNPSLLFVGQQLALPPVPPPP